MPLSLETIKFSGALRSPAEIRTWTPDQVWAQRILDTGMKQLNNVRQLTKDGGGNHVKARVPDVPGGWEKGRGLRDVVRVVRDAGADAGRVGGDGD